MEQSNKRVRINISLMAKGLVQWDITSEFESLEETKKNLADAINSVREVIKEKGLTEVGMAS
jgi:hypothetical protein